MCLSSVERVSAGLFARLSLHVRLDAHKARGHLAAYLPVGHHEMWAASQAGCPLTLLSFRAAEQGRVSREDIARAWPISQHPPG